MSKPDRPARASEAALPTAEQKVEPERELESKPKLEPRQLRPGFRNVVMVCRICEKRSKGPKKLAAKEIATHLSRACRGAEVARPRIVLTSCLGACPKKAITVVAVGPDQSLGMIAFRRGDDPQAAVAELFRTATR